MPEPPLELLLEVQRHDLLLDQLAYRRRELEERKALEALDRRMVELQAQAAGLRVQAGELSGRQEAIERQVGAYSSRIGEIERRMTEGGGAFREVQAMSEETQSLAKHRSDLEDAELEVMELLEPLERQLASLDAEAASLEEQRGGALAALAAAEQAIDAEGAGVLRERQDLAKDLPTALAADYERLRSRLGGVGASRLVEGACGGCHLRLPSGERDRLLHAGAGEVVHCDQCGRILVA